MEQTITFGYPDEAHYQTGLQKACGKIARVFLGGKNSRLPTGILGAICHELLVLAREVAYFRPDGKPFEYPRNSNVFPRGLNVVESHQNNDGSITYDFTSDCGFEFFGTKYGRWSNTKITTPVPESTEP